MPSRRRVLAAGSGLALTSLAGCLAGFGDVATLREVDVALHNSEGAARTFHVALETADGVLGWASRRVDPGRSDVLVIEPPGDVSPVALHGVVDDFAGNVELVGLDDLDGEYCLHLEFFHEHPLGGGSEILYSSDVRCRS